MTRVRISDASFADEFAEFLVRSGFVVERGDGATFRLRLPLTPGPARREEDIDVLLAVWVEIGLRIWRDMRPDSEVIVLSDEPALELAVPPALAS
ncbi:MAG: hypothetical protein M3304_13895 [Actinomycetota bacterium]|nr:hypothetical protein [Actinomycetota bacterium]